MNKILALVTAALVLAACGKTGVPTETAPNGVSVGNGFRLQMTADLSDAVSLTTTLGESSRHLLKVTSAKKFAEVLSGPHEIISWKETPTHIIAEASIYEGTSLCSLIAIPKVRGTAQVHCLRRDAEKRGTYSFDVHGSEVFFAFTQKLQVEVGNSFHDNRITEVRHWDGKGETIETLYHADTDFNHSPFINSVFTSDTNENLCFSLSDSDYDYRGTAATHGTLFCRQGLDKPWAVMKVRKVPDAALKFGNTILVDGRGSEFWKFDLAMLKSVERSGPLPSVRDFDLVNGGFLGRGDWRGIGGILTCVDKDGNGTKLTEVNADTNLVRIGDWVWFYGSQTLRRVSLVDCTLDAKDYFESTTLIQISSLDWAIGDFVRLDGTNGGGMPTTVHLTPTGALIRLQTERVKVNHPIDLKWDM